MKSNLSPRAAPPCLAVALVACLLVVASNSAMANEPDADGQPVASTSPGILETSTGLYEFTPTSCIIYIEDGVPDIEIQGPGTAPDGEDFYFDFSSTANEMTIVLGMDAPYVSSDRKLQAGQFVSNAFTVEASGDTVSVTGLNLVDEQGQPVDTNASLRIDCSK